MTRSVWEIIKSHRILNIVIAVLLLSLIFIFRNSRTIKNSNEEDIPLNASKREGNFELSINVSQSRFPLKTAIPFALSVTNVGNDKATLFFTSGQKFDLIIKDAAGSETWRWSKGRLFTMAIEELTLGKGEKVSLKVTWPQVDSAGNQVSPGKYRAIAESKASEVAGKVEVEFVIESSVERSTKNR